MDFYAVHEAIGTFFVEFKLSVSIKTESSLLIISKCCFNGSSSLFAFIILFYARNIEGSF